jgi:thioredoxin-dependent peroxiredoxin
MKNFKYLAVALLMSVSSMVSALEVGDMAPDFTLEGTDGKTYSLSQFKGKEAVIIAWFPKAFTKGCTIECKSLADNGHLLKKFNATYFMASVDPIEDNKGFAAEHGADFPMLSDPTKATAKAYNVLRDDRGFANRHTFYIDKEGVIVAIDRAVKPATSAEDMAQTLEDLKIAMR